MCLVEIKLLEDKLSDHYGVRKINVCKGDSVNRFTCDHESVDEIRNLWVYLGILQIQMFVPIEMGFFRIDFLLQIWFRQIKERNFHKYDFDKWKKWNHPGCECAVQKRVCSMVLVIQYGTMEGYHQCGGGYFLCVGGGPSVQWRDIISSGIIPQIRVEMWSDGPSWLGVVKVNWDERGRFLMVSNTPNVFSEDDLS